jgi:phosphoribosylglycinamide formyltransferase-1
VHRKILLVRANELRHKALSVVLNNGGHDVYEIIETKIQHDKVAVNSVVEAHFQSRKQVEMDFFSDLVHQSNLNKTKQIKCLDINTNDIIQYAKSLEVDLVITFGCSILKDPWFEFFQNSILGIHLGISPYYRGSGTNFFPFVNNELGAVGYTLMNLNEGVDTGNIIHQSYANMIHGDSIHTIGTRLMRKMFSDILKITLLKKLEFEFNSAVKQPYTKDCKIYRKRDFNSINLGLALKNISNQSIISFLENIDSERKKFPLIREINLDAT